MAILSKNTKIGNKKPLLTADNIKSKNIDLNDYTSEGIYIFKDLVTSSNFPKNYEWINNNPSHLQVFIFDNNNSSKVMQILTRYNCNNLFIRYSYITELNETVWTEWVIVGESVELSEAMNNLQYYGDITIRSSDEQYFLVSDDGSSIIGLSDAGKTQTELVIPYKIDGVEITNLYSGIWHTSILSGNSVITKIVIPNSVTSIGNSAFEMCSSLTSINIPNSVTSIGEYAFYDCSSLTSVNIPDNVTSIRDYAFNHCSSLASINIPDSVTSIGNSAFSNCTGLTSINIPNSVTSIGNGAFNNCSSLTSINIPNSVTSIGDGAFSGCTSLTSINIPNSVTSIGDGAFSGCTNLTIYCEPESYTETFAKTQNIPIMYTDISAETLDAKANAADVYTKGEVDTAISDVTTIANKAKTTADSKVKVVWVAKGESVPTTAEANSLCFRIL